MRKITILYISFIIYSCSSNTNLESRVKGFMKDTIATRFHDPLAYEFVAMKVDTIRAKDIYAGLQKIIQDTSLNSQIRQREAVNLYNLRNNMDSILFYRIGVTYKGKDKSGQLVTDTMHLNYNPYEDKITPTR
jgi:hypothetical protein